MEHHRRSIRKQGFDYSSHGAYFITLCAHHHQCIFGHVEQDRVRLNGIGQIVESCWNEIPSHSAHAQLDYFVIMPNHLHGIILLVGAQHAAPISTESVEPHKGPLSGSLPTIVRSFKSATTRRINQRRRIPGTPLWQRNFFERIIRDEDELFSIREYIHYNPRKWCMDRENPERNSTHLPEMMPWEPPPE